MNGKESKDAKIEVKGVLLLFCYDSRPFMYRILYKYKERREKG